MEVELDLLALEDTIDARVAQERQLEQRFQLAMYQVKPIYIDVHRALVY